MSADRHDTELSEQLCWLWLAECCGPASGAWGKLRHAYSSASEIARVRGEDVLRQYIPRHRRALSAMSKYAPMHMVPVLEYCTKQGIRIIPYDSPEYPSRLRSISDPPPVLFAVGHLPEDAMPHVGVVGTRALSLRGALTDYTYSHALASAGAAIVSGMAVGADAIAHSAACELGAPTVAVLGCGVDTPYPRSHAYLFDAICERGAVISEYIPGTAPSTYNFPSRNRIISAMSDTVFVVEGGKTSGSMLTALEAYRQGRRVMMPTANKKENSGYLPLEDMGGIPADTPDDVLAPLGLHSEEHTPFSATVPDLRRLAARYDILVYSRKTEGSRYPTVKRAEDITEADLFCEPDAEEPLQLSLPIDIPSPSAEDAAPSDPALDYLDPFTRRVYDSIPAGTAVTASDIISPDMPAAQTLAAITELELLGLVTTEGPGLISRK